MRSTHTTRTGTLDHILLGDKQVEFRLISSSSATKLRVRVGIAGIEVIQPEGRDDEDVLSFLQANSVWIIDQLDRVERFRNIRRPKQRMAGRMLFWRITRLSNRRGLEVCRGESCYPPFGSNFRSPKSFIRYTDDTNT